MRKATLKASVARPAPKRWAKTISRARPMTRLTAVPMVKERTPREMSSIDSSSATYRFSGSRLKAWPFSPENDGRHSHEMTAARARARTAVAIPPLMWPLK